MAVDDVLGCPLCFCVYRRPSRNTRENVDLDVSLLSESHAEIITYVIGSEKRDHFAQIMIVRYSAI